ncbi:unnamed protein product, partial [Mesorhabditis belari]|uniref:LRAT domain-containing protein n=1 Tax=Mesorhabditis belari TaxID=2138241 RepID=A0AAF3FC46_9BILA
MKHCGLVTAWLAYEEFIISEPIPGDLLEFSRNLYQHWAVYVGGGEVIHFSGEPQNKKNAKICRDKLSEVAGKSQLRINNEFDKKHRPHSEDEIVRRAESQIGEMLGNYNVISDNCECFAKWCRNGMYLSEQKNASHLDYAINAVGVATCK